MSIPTMKTILITMQSQIKFYRGLRCLPAMRPQICIIKSLLPPARYILAIPSLWVGGLLRLLHSWQWRLGLTPQFFSFLLLRLIPECTSISLCLALSIGTQCLPYSFLLVTYFFPSYTVPLSQCDSTGALFTLVSAVKVAAQVDWERGTCPSLEALCLVAGSESPDHQVGSSLTVYKTVEVIQI